MSEPRSNAGHLARAGATFVDIVNGVRPDQLDAATPCAEFDVRCLVNHLRYWGPSLIGSAGKQLVPPPPAAESTMDLVGPDWASELTAQAERTVSAWSAPDAWSGTTFMGGPTELPAAMVGGMVVGELVVHGWDLARATGQVPDWDDDLLAYLLAEVTGSAETGRAMGVYGPEVAVPAGASALERTLGLTGRDPAWTPER